MKRTALHWLGRALGVGAAAALLAGCASAVSEGPGVFQRVSLIHRVNTVGGIAPSYSGNSVGEEARVPYTIEYVFYRAK